MLKSTIIYTVDFDYPACECLSSVLSGLVQKNIVEIKWGNTMEKCHFLWSTTFLHVACKTLISWINYNKDYFTNLQKIDKLDVIRWLAEIWEEISNKSLIWYLKILLDHEGGHFNYEPICETEVKDENDTKFVSLLENISGVCVMMSMQRTL